MARMDHLLPLLLSVSLASTLGCGRDPTGVPRAQPSGVLEIQPQQLDLYLGQVFTYAVVERVGLVATDVLGRRGLELKVDGPAIVELDRAGTGRAVQAGEATLVATLGGRTVRAPIVVHAAALQSISVEPEQVLIGVGERTNITVRGRLTDGAVVDLTPGWTGTAYRAEAPAIATVDAEGGISGRAIGSTQIIVTHPPQFRDTVVVEVDAAPPELVALKLAPELLQLAVGRSAVLQVLGVRADGTEVDLIASGQAVQLESQDTATARVGAGGDVHAVREGMTLITARFGNLTAEAKVVVISDALVIVSIEAQPRVLQLGFRDRGQLRVIGRRSDGSVVDLTAAQSGTSYRSEQPAIAAVSRDGLVTSFDTSGTAQIRISSAGLFTSATIRVGDLLPVVDLVVFPQPVRLAPMESVQLTVLAVFVDGSRLDVTSSLNGTTYRAQQPNITVSGDGLVTGLFEGRAQLVVSYRGVERIVDVIVEATAPITLRISPDPLQVPVNGAIRFLVLAGYPSGFEQDVTFDPNLVLRPIDPSIAAIEPGRIAGLRAGQTTLFAVYGALRASAQIIVDAPVSLITIQLIVAGQLDVGASSSVSVLGFYSDGSVNDLTNDPATRLVVRDPAILRLSGASVTGLRAGVTTLSAEHLGFRSEVQVRVVQNDPVVGLAWEPARLDMRPGDSASARLMAIHRSGVRSDVTFDPSVQGSANGPIDIRPSPNGLVVVALASGFGQIDAFYQGFAASLPINITESELVALEIRVPSPLEIGQSEVLQVIGRRADGSTVDVTFDPALVLGVSPSGVIEVLPGRVIAAAAGRATITAQLGGLRAVAVVDVLSGDYVALVWQPRSLSLAIGETRRANLVARRRSGVVEDVSTDLRVSLAIAGPVRVGLNFQGFFVQGLAPGGEASLSASFVGLSAVLPVRVSTAAATLVRIFIQPDPLQVAVGELADLTVIGVYSDGRSQEVTSGVRFTSADLAVASVDPNTGMVRGTSAGTTRVTATAGGLSAEVTVVVLSTGPTISAINPDAIAVGSPDTRVVITGSGFGPGLTVTVNGVVIAAQSITATRFEAIVPEFLLATSGTLLVRVVDAMNRESNSVPIAVGEAPSITNLSPGAVVIGASTTVIAVGRGLNGITISAADLSFSGLSAESGGTLLRFTARAGAAAMPGPRVLTFRNRFGAANATLALVSDPGLVGRTVRSGQTAILSGTLVVASFVVDAGGRVVGSGSEPLTIVSTGNIEINGVIDVSGRAGDQGSQIAADGGDSGPGGAGGGAAGDGDTMTAPSGGAGSPRGSNGVVGQGSGTPGADGGGDSGGRGARGGCARAGGGGGLDGRGGSGGGELGLGSGGAGGLPGAGSTYAAGTGGGGGSTCGSSSGGAGGGGGGALVLQVIGAGSILIDGQIIASGGNGGEGFLGTSAGGGGSGGRVELIASGRRIVVNGAIVARGGAGGASDLGATGGGGAGGRITLSTQPGGVITTPGPLDVNGGSAGGTSGGGTAGTAGQPGTVRLLP
ncbi:MAG: Ig-like domain-containing protein [Deltaproteobacteria bacterium]|nr:Ig-like domain-containing protein [Deltaproteobacteria bacterium]